MLSPLRFTERTGSRCCARRFIPASHDCSMIGAILRRRRRRRALRARLGTVTIMRSNKALHIAAVGALAITALWPKPAKALDNPLTVNLRGPRSHLEVAAATIFGSGSTVLVDVTQYRAVLKGAAVTLNTGTCASPGSIAYRLSHFTKNASITELPHSLSEVAAHARSMTILQTASSRSATLACGKVID